MLVLAGFDRLSPNGRTGSQAENRASEAGAQLHPFTLSLSKGLRIAGARWLRQAQPERFRPARKLRTDLVRRRDQMARCCASVRAADSVVIQPWTFLNIKDSIKLLDQGTPVMREQLRHGQQQ